MRKIEKWIDLSELPRRGKFIDWKNSIGYKCKFKYDDVEGEIEIIDYKRCKYSKLIIKYLDYDLFEITVSEFNKCNFGKLLKKITNEFKIEIGQTFKDNKRDLTIINREYRIKYIKDGSKLKDKWYKYRCNKCGNEDWIVEYNLLKGNSCNVCRCYNSKPKLGFNTIYDTDKWMINLGVNEQDAKKYTSRSGQKIKVKCPDCGREKEIVINKIYYRKSIGCTCGDGISYPEKFIISLLDQLDIEYITQYSPKWISPKRYDFYFELCGKKYILEVNGEQHYKDCTNFDRSLYEIKINDQYKKELALNNGIDTYIELNCSKSNLDYIKNSILNSELNNIFDLSQIDWLKCEEFALSNRVKEVCCYWKLHNNINNEGLTTTDLIKEFNLDKNTIIKYLKQGTKLDWCNYNTEEEINKGILKSNKISKQICSKNVEIFNKNGKSLGVFESCNELERQSEKLFGVKLNNSNISAVATGKRKTHKGFTFKYI